MNPDTQTPPEYSYEVRRNFNNFYDLKLKLLKLSHELITEIKSNTNKYLKVLDDFYNSNILLKDPAEVPVDANDLCQTIRSFYSNFGSHLRQDDQDSTKKRDEKIDPAKHSKDLRPLNETQIFISGLPPMCTNEDLGQLFQHCGEILTTTIPPGEGQSRGFGFVTFATTEATQEALKLNGTVYLNKPIKVQLSRQKNENSRKADNRTTVFVGNLSCYTNENTLIDFFKGIGEPKTVRIARDPSGNVRGFAHVEFYFPHHAYAALKLNETILNGRPVRIELAGGGKKMQDGMGSIYYPARGQGGNAMMYGQYSYNPYI